MEYLIFIYVSLLIWDIYHRVQYRKSNYGKYEYYLRGETNEIMMLLIGFEVISVLAIIVGVIYFGGEFLKYLSIYL